MNKIIIFLLLVAIVVGLLGATSFGLIDINSNPMTQREEQYLDDKISKMINEKQVKGAIVSFVSDHNISLCKGYGYANENASIASDGSSTAFRIGSVSKTFIAIAALQLAAQGRLDMDTSITLYIDGDFPQLKYDVTMRNLLTHTAGFEEMLSGIAIYDKGKAEPLEVSIRKYMPAQVFPPGEVVSYSNYGIALAAYVIQCITDQDFYLYANENIFKPLNMTSTSFELDFSDVIISKAYKKNGEEAKEPYINLYPEGSVVSTAEDMAKYMLWLMDDSDKVLTTELKSQLFENHFSMAEEFQGMGFTWNRLERNGVTYFDKKGETVNFYTRIALYPKQKKGVFLSFNTYVEEAELDAIMEDVTTLILGQEQKYDTYTGFQSVDISGYYVSTRSNFEGLEKALNLFMPNNVSITGSLSQGFYMKGEALIPLGENYYQTPIGNIKYVPGNDKDYLAMNRPISYVRVNWHENRIVQLLIILFFILASLILAIANFKIQRNIKSSKNGYPNLLFISLPFINLIAVFIMCALIILGISCFNILPLVFYISLCGYIITFTSIIGIISTVSLFAEKIFLLQHILIVVWNSASVLFCLWMWQVNILF